MRDGCVEDEELQSYMTECVEMGCNAEQCGLTHFSCNQTSLVCANEFMRCDLTTLPFDDAFGDIMDLMDSADMDLELYDDMEGRPWCTTSFCIRNYFKCMEAANCVTEADLRQHLAICT